MMMRAWPLLLLMMASLRAQPIVVGAEHAAAEPRIVSALPDHVAIGASDREFLMIWAVDRNNNVSRISATGEVLSTRPLPVAVGLEIGSTASDGSSYVAGWTSASAVGVLHLDKDGALLGTTTLAEGSFADPPVVAWNGREYLAAWYSAGVHGALIDRDGRVIGQPFEINSGAWYNLSIAARLGEFRVAATYTYGGNCIVTVPVSESGVAAEATNADCGTTDHYVTGPHGIVATDDGYLLSWTRPDHSTVIAALDPSGKVGTITPLPFTFFRMFQADGGAVLFSPGEVTAIDDNARIVSKAETPLPNVRAAASNGRTLAVADASNVAIVDSVTLNVSTPVNVVTTQRKQSSPQVALAADGTTLVAWADGDGIRIGRNRRGVPLDGIGFPLTGFNAAVQSNGKTFLVLTGGRDATAVIVPPSGPPGEPIVIEHGIVQSSSAITASAVVARGDDYFAFFIREQLPLLYPCSTSPGYRIEAARITADGRVAAKRELALKYGVWQDLGRAAPVDGGIALAYRPIAWVPMNNAFLGCIPDAQVALATLNDDLDVISDALVTADRFWRYDLAFASDNHDTLALTWSRYSSPSSAQTTLFARGNRLGDFPYLAAMRLQSRFVFIGTDQKTFVASGSADPRPLIEVTTLPEPLGDFVVASNGFQGVISYVRDGIVMLRTVSEAPPRTRAVSR